MVVCDRYLASSVAYGEAQGLDRAWLCRDAAVPAAAGSDDTARHPAGSLGATERARIATRYEQDLALLGRVRDSYLRQAAQAAGCGSTRTVTAMRWPADVWTAVVADRMSLDPVRAGCRFFCCLTLVPLPRVCGARAGPAGPGHCGPAGTGAAGRGFARRGRPRHHPRDSARGAARARRSSRRARLPRHRGDRRTSSSRSRSKARPADRQDRSLGGLRRRRDLRRRAAVGERFVEARDERHAPRRGQSLQQRPFRDDARHVLRPPQRLHLLRQCAGRDERPAGRQREREHRLEHHLGDARRRTSTGAGRSSSAFLSGRSGSRRTAASGASISGATCAGRRRRRSCPNSGVLRAKRPLPGRRAPATLVGHRDAEQAAQHRRQGLRARLDDYQSRRRAGDRQRWRRRVRRGREVGRHAELSSPTSPTTPTSRRSKTTSSR